MKIIGGLIFTETNFIIFLLLISQLSAKFYKAL